MTFKSALKVGKKGEMHFLSVLEENNIAAVLNEQKKKFADYDIECKLGRTKFTVEIKYDLMAEKTENIAIEYYNSSTAESSGMDSTKADLWGHIIPDGKSLQCFLTSVKLLKGFVKKNKPFKKIAKAGDGNASLYLYRTNVILPAIFKDISNLTESQLKKLIKLLLK